MGQVERKKRKWLETTVSFAIGGVFVFLFFCLATPADAGNQQITFQGKLTNASGNTVSDGTYYVKLSIYDAATGGTCQYTASSTCSSVTSTAVTVANGIFSINLGDTSASLAAISPTLFNNSALYLGVTVCSGAGTGCDSEMTPRKRITAAPYAFNADYLSGLATSTIGGVGSYVPVTDSSGNLKITNSLLIATTTAGQFGVGTTTIPSGVKAFIDSTTASDKLLVIRANSSQTGNLQEWQNNAGTALVTVNSSGNISTSGTLATFGNATIGGHLYPSTDNLYDIGASSTQWRYGNFQGGILIADGSTTSTLLNNSLTLGQASGFNFGKFYVDSNGLVSASSSIYTYGNVTSTGHIYPATSNVIDLGALNTAFRNIYASSSVNVGNSANSSTFMGNYLGLTSGVSSTVLNASSLTLGSGTKYISGMFNVDSSGNVSASGTLAVFDRNNYGLANIYSTDLSRISTDPSTPDTTGSVSAASVLSLGDYNDAPGGFLVLKSGGDSGILFKNGSDNLIAAQLGISDDSGGFQIVFGSGGSPNPVTSTIDLSQFVLNRGAGFNKGRFFINPTTGDTSASGSLRIFGNVTSTGIIYASGGLISSASSTFSNLLNITGDIRASSTFQVTGDTTLYGALIAASNTSSLRSIYLSGLTVAPNTQAGSLYFNSSDAKFYGYTANGTAVDLGVTGGSNWSFTTNYGVQTLTPSSTIALWSKGNLFASSTLFIGSTTASSTVVSSTSFILGQGANYNSGIFAIDSNGNVSTSGTLNVMAGPNPAGSVIKPVHRGSVTASNWQLDSASGVFVSGNYMYVVANADDALEIFDISTSTPTHVGVLTNGTGGAQLDGATSIFVAGHYAYITISTTVDGLEVVDISDPANPKHKGFLGVTASNYLYGANDVFVVGNYAYVATGDAGGNALVIIDASNPSNPTFVGALTDGTGGARLGGASVVRVVGNLAYVVSDVDDAFEVVDVSNPLNPVHKGSLSDGGASAPYLSNPYGLFISGNFAYVTASADNAFEIIDISNPTSPIHKGSLTNGTGGALLNVPAGVFVAGNYAYIAVSTSDALEIMDVSDPANPRHTSSLVDGSGGAKLESAWSIFVSGNYAYVTNKTGTAGSGTGAVGIVDVSGAVIPNAYIGSTKVDTLQVQNYAQFNQGLLVRGGLNVGGSTQLLGDVSIGGGRATSTNMGGGGLTIFTNQTSSTLTSRVFNVTGATGFIFNSGTSTWTGSDRNLVSFQTGGVDKFLFAADGSVIVNKASSYNSGYLSVGNTGSLSTSGTLQIFGGATTGGLIISATNATTTFYSYASNAVGSAGFVFNSDITSTTIGTALERVIFAVKSRDVNKFLISGGGNVYATAGFNANSAEYGIGDVAEYVNLVFGESVEPGDVLVVDKTYFNQYKKSNTAYTKEVAGVVSETGAFIMGAAGIGRAPLALAGLVRVKVTDENGPIAVGDYLVTASESGYAMKYDSDSGKSAGLVGMALEPLESGDGKITILVNKGLVVGNQVVGSELTVSQNGSGQVVWGNDSNLHLLGRSILDVLSIKSQDEKWMIDEDGYLVVKVKTQQGDKELYGLQSGQDKEVVFSGSSQLEDGVKRIELPAIDKEIVDLNAPIKVSVTLTGEANGVFVTEKSYEGFTVKELNSGTSDATFDWLVIAKRRAVTAMTDDETLPESTEVPETPVEVVPDATEEVSSEVDTVPVSEEGDMGQANEESLQVDSTEEPVDSPEVVSAPNDGEEAALPAPAESASL